MKKTFCNSFYVANLPLKVAGFAEIYSYDDTILIAFHFIVFWIKWNFQEFRVKFSWR